jgi:hypothetical protein
MRDNVRAAFVDAVGEHGALSSQDAEALIHQLATTDNRYRPDVWLKGDITWTFSPHPDISGACHVPVRHHRL